MPASEGLLLVDGSLDYSGGVDSLKVPTVASVANPNGLGRNQLAWLVNATVRAGAIQPRAGWNANGTIRDAATLYQGGHIYEPLNGDPPYLIISLSGQIWKVALDFVTPPVNLTQQFDPAGTVGLANPASLPQSYFVQGEEFMVIQAGDLVTLPLFWDGVTLRRSAGIGGAAVEYQAVASFVIPAVGSSVVVSLSTVYAGHEGEAVSVVVGARNYGQFTVDSILQSGGSSQITLKAFATNFSATTIPAGTIQIVLLKSYELPPATCMTYFMGRIWYAQGRQYSAGDIVGSSASGTLPYGFRDAILKVTENPLALGGDGFMVPSQSGDITALTYTANLNSALGQGVLTIFTQKAVYQCQVPVTRAQWRQANSNSQPLQVVVQLANGATGERAVVPVNGDLFFQSLEPSVRSLMTAMRYFGQWGNVPVSSNQNRILRFVNRSLLPLATGVLFDNRLLESSLPEQQPQGVVHKALLALDFTPISTLESQVAPVWEGHWEGLSILQLFTSVRDGVEKAYAVVVADGEAPTQHVAISGAPPNGNVNNPYSFSFTAAGGTAPYSWSITGGTVPIGLTFAGGTLAGTPTAAGTSTFTVTVTDATGLTASVLCSVTIAAQVVITITNGNPPNGQTAPGYTFTFTATGGTTPYTWHLVSGAFPTGLALDPNTGVLSGTPSAAGAFTFVVRVQDVNGITVSSPSYTVNIVAVVITITAFTPPAGIAGVAYGGYAFQATGGTLPYNWSVPYTGLPGGMSVDAAGNLTGTPATPGTYNFLVRVSDAVFNVAHVNVTFVITGTTLTPVTPLNAFYGQAYGGVSYVAVGGTPPYTYEITAGSLPPGLLLNSGGDVSGIPLVAGSFNNALVYNFTVQATDAALVSATQNSSISVLVDIRFTNGNVPTKHTGPAITFNFTATGGVGAYAYTLDPGSDSGNFSLAPNGTLTIVSGTIFDHPKLYVRATDANGNWTTKLYTLSFAP